MIFFILAVEIRGSLWRRILSVPIHSRPDPYHTPSGLQATESWNLDTAAVSGFFSFLKKHRPKAQSLNQSNITREVYVKNRAGLLESL